MPRPIPDNAPRGAASAIHTRPVGFAETKVLVTASIAHTYVGDLVIQVVAPDGQVATLSNHEHGSQDDFSVVDLDITSSFAPRTNASGTWRLRVRDDALADTGEITGFSLTITATRAAR